MSSKDRKILQGMLEFALRVDARLKGVTLEKFLSDLVLQDSVLYALGQLGEKTNLLSDSFLEQYPSDDWYKLIGLRNRLFHSYEDIKLDMVYEMAKNDIGNLINNIVGLQQADQIDG